MILVIDNYDSFTYNLVQYIGSLGPEVKVFRNDKITTSEIQELKPERIVISPGPGRPENAGISVAVVKKFYNQLPILGVCLGHQAIVYAFGGKIVHAKRLMHGKVSLMQHTDDSIFSGIPSPFEATRYHSLIVEKETIPKEFHIIATTEEDEIMGIRMNDLPVWGLQFHPESILTKDGLRILENFLKY